MAISYVISIAEHWTTWSTTTGNVQFGKRSLDEAMHAVVVLAICEAAGPSSPRHINKAASFCSSPLLALQVTDCASRDLGAHSAKGRGGG